MIDIKTLTENDKGKWVIYKGGAGETEIGRIKSWNDKVIFVVYDRPGRDMNLYELYPGYATSPEDLSFMKSGMTNV